MKELWSDRIRGQTQDQTSPRANTLSDDADDTQKQLDNEARDRMKYGRPKTIWVFHFPNHASELDSIEDSTENWTRLLRGFETPKLTAKITPAPAPPQDWDYKTQNKWSQLFPNCGGRSQSPVDIPVGGLVKAKGARRLHFANYDVMPMTLTLMNDGKRVMLFGEWPKQRQPLVYGGAAHSRRYVFHSLTVHWPSEHTVGGLQYPMETQALHISAEYKTMDQALNASPGDPQAFLGITNLYKFANQTQKGLNDILNHALGMSLQNTSLETKPLSYFNPPFKEYACYQGSLSTPPCTESVLWFIRGRALTVVREMAEASHRILGPNEVPEKIFFRQPQPLNDRRIFLFS